jgi:hypothetical protein
MGSDFDKDTEEIYKFGFSSCKINAAGESCSRLEMVTRRLFQRRAI